MIDGTVTYQLKSIMLYDMTNYKYTCKVIDQGYSSGVTSTSNECSKDR